MQQLETTQVLDLLGKPGTKIVDIRPMDAYNGWRMKDEPRGGHIKTATALPFKWTGYIDWFDIVRSKGLEDQDKIVVYGYDEDQTNEAARRFERAGFTNVSVYHKFLEQWSPDRELPMSHLERYAHLVPPVWLQTLIDTGTAPELNNDKYVICHSHYQNRSDYEKGHIPGAVDIDTNDLESPDTWNRRSPEELKKTLEQTGITHDTTVILYGRFASPDTEDPFPGSSSGHLGAMRCAAIMLYAGVKDVRILNGGVQSWTDDGYELTTEETSKNPVAEFGVDIPQHPEYFIDLPQAKEYIANPNKNLVSVRSWREHIGEMSGYNYIEKKGRIPGTVFGNGGTDPYHMQNYRNLDHTFREYHEIARKWKELGVTPDKPNAFYCGTGWRGSEGFMNAWLMGWPQVAVFDGGWFEWSSDPANPFETGIPKEQPTAG